MNRINLICLGVRDMAKSVTFYRDGLGFETKEIEDNPTVIFFNNAGTKLELYPIDLLSDDFGGILPTLEPNQFNGMTLAYNTKSKEEVASTISLARQSGARILKEPQDVFWGGYHAYFADPDNYVWEVCWNPEMPFDESDMVIV
ncbi:VOC family protein [Streptococcus hongkongensis]|nr:glyoxalase [Streptococcus uberis]